MKPSLVVVIVLAACSKEPPAAPTPRDPIANQAVVDQLLGRTPIDAPPGVVAQPAYHPAPILMVTDEVAPATLDWNRTILTERELEEAMKNVEHTKARLGTFIVLV